MMIKNIFIFLMVSMLVACSTNQYPDPIVIPVVKQAVAPTATAGVVEITRVTSDPAPELLPRLSNDNKSLLVTVRDLRKQGSESLSVVSLKMNSPGRRLVAGPYASGANWIDNNEVIYSYLRPSSPTLVKQSLNVNGMRFLSASAYGESDQLANYNEISGKLTFQTSVGGVLHVATVGLDGRDYTVFTEGQYPRWMSDGNSIVFQKRVGLFFQIFILNIKTGTVTQITNGQFDNAYAAVSPNGRKIAFVSNKDGRSHLYTMKIDGTNLRQITSGNTQEAFPEWYGENQVLFSSDAGAESKYSGSAFRWPHANIWKVKLAN